MATETCYPIPEIPLEETPHGKAPVVVDEFGCLASLVMVNPDDYPALEIALSDDEVQLRDGSAEHPIELPHLQKQVGGSFTKMMIQDASGKWFVFIPPVGCVNQRLIITNGSFMFVDDVLPSILESELCPVASCDEYDYLIGAKLVYITCQNGGSKQYLKWCLVPRVLCPECPA